MPLKHTDSAKLTVSATDQATPSQAWQNAAGQKETTARLHHLPAGVSFDDAVGEPIYYDPGRYLLLYRGFMCQASYNYLHKLSLDPEYEAAIDQLYMASAAESDGRTLRGVVLSVVLLAVLAVVWAVWFWLR